MNKEQLTALVAEILDQMAPQVKASEYKASQPSAQKPENAYHDGDFVPDVTQLDLRKLYLTDAPADKERFARMKLRTPARLGMVGQRQSRPPV